MLRLYCSSHGVQRGLLVVRIKWENGTNEEVLKKFLVVRGLAGCHGETAREPPRISIPGTSSRS